MPGPALIDAARGGGPGRGSAAPSIWKCTPFLRLWSAALASNVGTQMNNVAKAWLLFQLTHSAIALGVEGVCFSAPMAVLPLVAGRLADRFDRRRLVLITLVLEAAQAATLAGFAEAGTVRPWMLYVAAALDASRLSLNIPAQGALLADVMSRDLLPRAIAVSSITWSSSALVGPAAGGALLAATGAAPVFAVNAAVTIVAILAIATLRPRVAGASALDAADRSAVTGYLRREPRMVWCVLTLTVAMVGVLGVETLLPIFSASVWHAGATGYGLLRTAPGVAAIVTGLVFSGRLATGRAARRHTSSDRIVACALVASALGLFVFAATPPFVVGLGVLGVASAGFSAVQIRAGVELQICHP